MFSCSPEETKKLKGICPKCGKPLTLGVDYRVEELSDQKIEENLNQKMFYKMLPLHEVISLAVNSSLNTKKVWGVYDSLIKYFGTEFNILINVTKEEFLEKHFDEKLIDLILKNREGKIKVIPGYDGTYGVAQIEEQKTLF